MTDTKTRHHARDKARHEAVRLSHPEIRAIVLGIMLAMFLGALDQTIVATALPTIGRRFGDVGDLSWVVTAYLLTGTAVTPLYGKLSDIHGRRAVMLTAIALFMAGSLACALSRNMEALIFSRALQGSGGGGLVALAQTIIADIVSPRERGRYQGYIGAVFAASSVGGPVLGGFLTQHLDWSLIFWINIPLGFAALGMTANALEARAVSRAQASPRRARRRADDVGLGDAAARRCPGAGGTSPGSRRRPARCLRRPRCCGACSPGGWWRRPSRFCRSACSPIRWCAARRSPAPATWERWSA